MASMWIVGELIIGVLAVTWLRHVTNRQIKAARMAAKLELELELERERVKELLSKSDE